MLNTPSMVVSSQVEIQINPLQKPGRNLTDESVLDGGEACHDRQCQIEKDKNKSNYLPFIHTTNNMVIKEIESAVFCV